MSIEIDKVALASTMTYADYMMYLTCDLNQIQPHQAGIRKAARHINDIVRPQTIFDRALFTLVCIDLTTLIKLSIAGVTAAEIVDRVEVKLERIDYKIAGPMPIEQYSEALRQDQLRVVQLFIDSITRAD